MIIPKLKHPWSCLPLCMAIRVGKIRSTAEVRAIAKQVSFGEAYSTRGSLMPMNREYNTHLNTYDNTNLFIARIK
jgi:hypothetical protein